MVLRMVKWAVQAALLLHVLQHCASVYGISVSFETLDGEQEERAENEIPSTPSGPFNPRPSTASLVSGHEDFLKKMGVDASLYERSGSTGSDSSTAGDLSSVLSNVDGSGSKDKNFVSLLRALDGSGSSGNNDDLSSLLSALDASGSSSGNDDLSSLLSDLGGSGSGSMASFDEFMKKMGPSLGGMDGLGALFGMVDPTVPQNLTVDDGDIIYGDVLGSLEHGEAFSDIYNLKFGQYIVNITLRGSARLDSIGIIAMTQGTYGDLVHGGQGGGMAFVAPQLGSTISSVEVHWEKHNGKTRIFYLEIITSDGQVISAGKKTSNSAVIKPPKDFQIAGFHGRASSSGIFGIGAIFMKNGVKDLSVEDVMAVSEKGSPGIYHYNTTIRNWVGPVAVGSDGGCYMKRHSVSSKNMCPSGYRMDGGQCVTQCPLHYPIDCFLECIPPNADCAHEVIAKTAAVISVALNVATMGVFGSMLSAYKTANFVVMCAVAVVNAIKSLMFYLRYMQTRVSKTKIERMMDEAFRLQIATIDLPIAICTCLGIRIPNKLMFPAIVVTIVATLVMMAIMIGEQLFHSKVNVLMMLRESGVLNGSAMKHNVMELDDFLSKQNTTCGLEMQTLTSRVIGKVKEIRDSIPGADENDVRVEVSNSPIMMEDIPIVTNHCMGEIWANTKDAAAYKTRHVLRKTLNIIIEQLIKDGTTDMPKHVVRKEKALEYSNLGLFFLSMVDPTGIAWMASEFVQPICGPAEFLGEIDDGRLREALGLTTTHQAFEGSYGIWKKKGDGSVIVYFESFDIYDVDVVIYSAGEKIHRVKVPAHGKVTWTATVEELKDKTLYMDRWRPGLFGLPGSGGGSLLLWIPRTSQGGHLILHARINVS